MEIVFCVFDVCEWRAEGYVSQTVAAQTEVVCSTGGLVMQGSPQPRSTNSGAGTAVTSWHALRVSRQSETPHLKF